MRRRPRRLEVTTFPFLAVLLCTMGSLILLLLVLDRRAKIVAMRKAHEDAAMLASQRASLDEQTMQRKAEWEKRRGELHATLLGEQTTLLEQIELARQKATNAEVSLQTEQDRTKQLQAEIQVAESRLAESEQQVAARQQATVQQNEKSAAAQRELDRQTTELARLERALADLKALRQRQQQAYSIVPYLGPRGDNRKPIYLECSGDGMTFHPGGVVLAGLGLTPVNLRAEVEKRIGGQDQKVQAAKGDETRPYLLMLVRPDGIRNYYKAQEALADLKIDFGYEFIEQQWALDFSANAKADVAIAVSNTAKEAPASKPGTSVFVGGKAFGPPPPIGTGTGAIGAPHMTSPDGNAASPGFTAVKPGSIGTLPSNAKSALGGLPSTAGGGSSAGKQGSVGTQPGVTLSPPGGASTAAAGGDAKDSKAVAIATKDQEPKGVPGGSTNKNGGGSVFSSTTGSPAPSLGRILGNRDFIIVIECRSEGAVLRIGNQKFSLASLSLTAKGEHPLTKAVRETIARRQAMLGPGEPPYRPIVRFQVHDDGLAAYYQAYPLLDGLNVPLQRENIEKEDS